MSSYHRTGCDSVLKRSNSLPAINSIIKTKGVVKFFSRRNSSGSESSSDLESINFSKERKKCSVFETTDDDGKDPSKVLKMHLHPKARYSTKLPTPHDQEPETWKERFHRALNNTTRRIRRFRH
ncbi:hypothetical protein CDAR_284251 [Caerostris darwini]|uniref:Uncharacterized protein n=1 Tax=Caerostris darwini TaxID=1538125 RepID=A0AAV4U1W4_9ARAC|nr:hypothetical protein CDAR_284251 [Caerostris darwini]